ncbi:2OG-Fe dioxygenase family protein [Streptomyces sp. NBC_00536]|uniref:2OG-Fe dioxygenase family protein n=1 Tax=Streptomyces sp. NBC_00536 TaxID=2975769 RepID=UPI002E823493|nr:2OG-Fe dioxygenase family protein [Streptomyces sp. NBC_00536]WUC79596.1 2OG-Fe dioxygenase family protein [Streptomyces sp. NBC_00536]
MTLNKWHFQLLTLPELPAEILEEFPTLPVDRYNDGKFRHRRFSQYKIRHTDGGWQPELLPHRAFAQATEFNGVTGGLLREFEPLQIDPALVIRAGADEIPLDHDTEWQVDVHQWRVISNDDTRGVSVPEGPHQDGHTYSLIAVVDRHNIGGGETQLMPMDSDEPFLGVKLQPGQAVVIDDRKMRHYATDIVAPRGEEGHRDLFLLAYNAWPERRYGEEYETSVLAGA